VNFYVRLRKYLSGVLIPIRWLVEIYFSNMLPVRRLRKPWALTRTACFGNDIFLSAFSEIKQFKAQKTRSDALSDLISKSRPIHPIEISLNFMRIVRRKDVLPLIVNQNLRISPRSDSPEFVLIDTYSDLTDQSFKHLSKEYSFFSHYSDLHGNVLFDANLKCGGLLNLSEFEALQVQFIDKVRRTWGNTPIVYLTYPVGLETRSTYLARATEIQSSLQNLTTLYKGVSLIDFTGAPVTPSPDDLKKNIEFPYHYGPELYSSASKALSNTVGKSQVQLLA